MTEPNRKTIVLLSVLDFPLIRAINMKLPEARILWWDDREPEAVTAALRTIQPQRIILPKVLSAQLPDDLGAASLEELDGELERLHRSGEERLESDSNSGPVLFCPSNDTHVMMFSPISKHLSNFKFLMFDSHVNENSREMARELGIEFVDGGASSLEKINPSVAVFANDWYSDAHRIISAAHKQGVPTTVIQEGCLDFGRHRRLRWSDFPMLQGIAVLDHIRKPAYILTGNPRFDSIKEVPQPDEPRVLINSNFSYGAHEEHRDSWVGDVVNGCRENGVDFFISKHPRDPGQFPGLPVWPSQASVVHDHIAQASIVVTRFSTLVYEALLMGRQVVYYNPHGEDQRLFNEDETGAILKASDSDQLTNALRLILEGRDGHREKIRLFLDLHCGPRDGKASKRCASALTAMSRLGRSFEGGTFADRMRFKAISAINPWFAKPPY